MGDFMGIEGAIDLKAEEDGKVYILRPDTGKWQILSDLSDPEKDLPLSIKRQINEIKKKAKALEKWT